MSVDQFILSADTTNLNYPEIRPSLDLNFARTKTLDPRITFTRASSGSYVGADGLIKYAGINEARFDHDPVTGESLGLLIEEARTNLIPYSEDFGNAAWTKEPGVSAVGNRINFPAASNFSASVGVFGERIYDIMTVPVSSVCTATLIVPPSANWSDSTATIKFGIFNDLVETLITSKSYWQFIHITATDNGNGSLVTVMKANKALTIDGLKVQLEVGSFPTSYIPTQGSTRTRATDSASITGKNFSEWYRQDEGTVFCEAKGIDNISGDNTRRYYEFNNQGSSNFRILSGYPSSTVTRFLIVNNGLVQADLFQTNQSPFKNNVKTTSSFGNGYFRFYSNGLSAPSVNFGTVPTLDRVFIGGGGLSSPLVLNGTIKKFTYYPKRLPDPQLQALTR